MVENDQYEDIAGEDEIKVVGGTKQWRFSRGKIVRGEEKTGPDGQKYCEEERPRIVGRLMRVGIFEGEGENKVTGLREVWLQVEADIQGRDELIHVKAQLSDGEITDHIELKPSVSAVKFAWGLTQFKRGDVVMIETSQSKEPIIIKKTGKKGDKVTYVNWYRVDGRNATPLFSPKRKPGEESKGTVEQWLELEPLIRAHSAYEDRVVENELDALSHLGQLTAEMKAKGWPTPESHPNAWLELMSKGFGRETVAARLSDFTDDQWGQIRLSLQPVAVCPPNLMAAAAASPPAAVATAPTPALNPAAFGAYRLG